ncbi:MAG: ABC transporter permease [Thermofilaceae archaeon]
MLRRNASVKEAVQRSRGGRIPVMLLKSPSIAIPLAYLALLVAVAALADYIAPYHYARGDLAASLKPPSPQHPLGTDHLGRDVLSRLIYGTRPLIQVISTVLAISIPLGVLIGVTAGYYGGLLDLVVSRVVDALMVFPTILIALFIVAVLGPGLENVVLAIVIAEIPTFARLTRALVLVEKELTYVEAAKALGASSPEIILRHILPSIAGPLLVQATFSASTAIMWEAALSFLGLGIQPPTPSWGLMMYEARRYFRTHPYLMIWPGLAIFVTVFMLNTLGEKLRDLLDPRMKYVRV